MLPNTAKTGPSQSLCVMAQTEARANDVHARLDISEKPGERGKGVGNWKPGAPVTKLINIRTDFRTAPGYPDQTLPLLLSRIQAFFTKVHYGKP